MRPNISPQRLLGPVQQGLVEGQLPGSEVTWGGVRAGDVETWHSVAARATHGPFPGTLARTASLSRTRASHTAGFQQPVRPRRGGSPRPSCAPRASAVWSHLVCDREFRHSPKALLQDRSETAFPFFALAWPPARTSGRPRVRVRRRERWRTSSPLTASPYSSLVMPASRTRSSRWRVRPPPRSRPKTPPPSLRGLCAPAGLEAASIPHLTRRF